MQNMTRIAGLLVLFSLRVNAADVNPVVRVWRVNPQGAGAAEGLRKVLPDVHSVRWDERYAYVESAGIALQSLGPLEVNAVEAPDGLRKFIYKFPLAPKLADGGGVRVPTGVVGAFVNGVPLYNYTSYTSYGDQNLWHLDAVAAAAQTAANPPLLQSLLHFNQQHSPLIGYALDGFPIYGPFGWGSDGTVRRFRSSYKLRGITKRNVLPDGTALTPAQEGPAPSGNFPLGMFVEDYEYISGSGDLDEHNGRWTRTPEYPNGTYAYFLSTDLAGRMMYPYLVGPTYAGSVTLSVPFQEPVTVLQPVNPAEAARVALTLPVKLDAGKPAALSFLLRDSKGRVIRFPERVHEKPMHLAVVSSDLETFAHIHPELQPDEAYVVNFVFPRAGKYWLYADMTPPGEAQKISRFEVTVSGSTPKKLPSDSISGEVRVRVDPPKLMETGVDLPFRFHLEDAKTGEPITDLQPYLGSWAHIMVVSKSGQEFLHVHPLDDGSFTAAKPNPFQHFHAAQGPSPSVVDAITGFAEPGLYKLWIQFQRNGRVITVPYTFDVQLGRKRAKGTPVPDAIRIEITRAGFVPSRIAVPAGKPFRLAFDRKDAANCAGTVVFPDLGIRKDLPPGDTTVVELPALPARELTFSCGMQMYRGSVVLQ